MTLFDFAKAYQDKKAWCCIPCEPKGKKALIAWKPYQDRLPDEQELHDFFIGYDERNLAIITGDVSNRLLVIDFDHLELFCEWWMKRFRRASLAVTTGKGVHIYFSLADGEAAPVNGKFQINGQNAGDIRYNGGYVLAPPSIHPSGAMYRWIDAPFLTVKFDDLKLERPAKASDAPPRQPGRPPAPAAPENGNGTLRNPKAYAESALEQECQKVQAATKGLRNNQIYVSAVKLAKYGQILGTEWIRIRLLSAATAVGLPTMEASRTINSGLNKALVRRCLCVSIAGKNI